MISQSEKLAGKRLLGFELATDPHAMYPTRSIDESSMSIVLLMSTDRNQVVVDLPAVPKDYKDMWEKQHIIHFNL